MGARSWCERRSQPPPQSHHHRNNQQEVHLRASHQQEERGGVRFSSAAAPSPGPPEYRPVKEHQPTPPHVADKPPQHAKPISRTNSPPPPFEPSAMYTASTVKERERIELGLLRDRQVRLNSVQTDILLDLPPAIALPDGEEHRTHTCKLRHAHGTSAGYGSVHLIHLRDAEQESEIYRGYIRPPPNRTVLERGYPHPPPPYGSSASVMVGLYDKRHSPPPLPLPSTRYIFAGETDVNLPPGESLSDEHHRGLSLSAQRYGSPPSYSQVAATAAADSGTKVKNKMSTSPVDGSRTSSGDVPDDEVRLLPDDRAAMCKRNYESYDEYSDSPPSYSDIVGSNAGDYHHHDAGAGEAPTIARQRNDGV